jgi:hypothetical protein
MTDLATSINTIKFTGVITVGQQFRTLNLPVEQVGPAVGAALQRSETRALRLARGILTSAPDGDHGMAEARALIKWASKAGSKERKLVTTAMRLSADNLRLIHEIAMLPSQDVSPFVDDYFAAGGDMQAVAQWLHISGGVLRGQHVAGLHAAGLIAGISFGGPFKWVKDQVGAVGSAIAKPVKNLVDAVVRAGKTIADIVAETVAWSVEQVADLVTALIEAGERVAEILGGALTKGVEALERFVQALVAIGRSADEILGWAMDAARWAGDTLWDTIGTIAVKVKISISYALLYLERDYLPGIKRFVKGALAAGLAVAEFTGFLVTCSFNVAIEIVIGLLDFGATLGALLIETARHPENALENLLRAAEVAGKRLQDIYHAAIVETGEQVLGAVTRTLVRLGKSVKELLDAALEVYGGAVGTVISILLGTLGSYRPLTQQEKDEARLIFGTSIDLDRVYVSAESLTNDIIFGLQDWWRGTDKSRPFTTDTLINFDVDEGIERHTLIHELTHVWQALVTGPFYMSEAIHAQIAGDGYNYGYVDEVTGEGAQQRLIDAAGDFEQFNREQQAQIIEHYYVRRFMLGQSPGEYAPWQIYADRVRVSSFIVQGAIRARWEALGGSNGFLGHPTTDELPTPDRVGRYNHFQGGSIYWTPAIGACEVHGLIREKWAALGWEQGALGYPTSDETDEPDGSGRYSTFEHGSLHWNRSTNQVTVVM